MPPRATSPRAAQPLPGGTARTRAPRAAHWGHKARPAARARRPPNRVQGTADEVTWSARVDVRPGLLKSRATCCDTERVASPSRRSQADLPLLLPALSARICHGPKQHTLIRRSTTCASRAHMQMSEQHISCPQFCVPHLVRVQARVSQEVQSTLELAQWIGPSGRLAVGCVAAVLLLDTSAKQTRHCVHL